MLIPAFGGALAGYGYATGRKGLLVAGVVITMVSVALGFAGVAAARAQAAK